jgi:predicted RNase H-related nuclease YkuK (DUF458 family)
MNPYGSLASGQYSNADVADEFRRSGVNSSDAYANYSPAAPATGVNYGMFSSSASPMESYPGQAPPVQPGFGSGRNYSQMTAGTPKELWDKMHSKESRMTRADFEEAMAEFGKSQNMDPKQLYGAVDVQVRDGVVVSERMLEQRSQVIAGVKPVYTVEKIVEIPQVIVREHEREVYRPEVIERIIEVPKMEIQERKVVGPPQVLTQEQIVEVPQIVTEERIVRVPRREIQERLIEVPKVEYVERIEYEDFVEYREVVVDKIIEVPEVEYRVREVEYLVPQTYIQEYYIDRYKEFPVTQVQEVERIEHVPVEVPKQAMQQYQQQPGYIPSMSMTAPAQEVSAPMTAMASQTSMTAPAYAAQPPSQVSLGACYTTYGGTSIKQMPPQQASYTSYMTAPASYSAAAPPGSAVFSQAPMQSVQYMSAPVQSYSYATYDPGMTFDQLDKNGDGVISKEEFQSAYVPKTSVPAGYSMSYGQYSNMSPMPSGAMTPPMAPGYNPYNPFQSSAAVPAAA